ncbi:MAG TPA: mannose-6-phosphate isomerase, class I, partial [Flavisolibacter sp.]|nr:mannose-6-phosphate isomerase, class I [Flavisolibacter sp.]
MVQHYSWGGSAFIPALLQQENTAQKPFAEYWLGAHPKAPSVVVNGEESTLDQLIASSPEEILGKRVQQQFGSLPYLLKILDVRQMLSIQVHPSIASAIKGYAEENEKGIPVSAPHRNYKDQNHKPELMAALSDFWLLHGFKAEEGIRKVFETVPEFSFLQETFAKNGYHELYEKVMTLPQEKVDKALDPLMQKVMPLYRENKLAKSDAHFWAARAVETFCKDGHYDRG